MVEIPTFSWAHLAGNIAVFSAASLSAWWQARTVPQADEVTKARREPSYYRALALGAVLGAWLVGSLNTMPSTFTASHSVAGALAGGIVSVEAWKWRRGVRGSTGGSFVLPLTLGIMIGRLGCLFSGFPDFTYGVPTQLP